MYSRIPSTWILTISWNPSSLCRYSTSDLLSWNRFSVKTAGQFVCLRTYKLASLSGSPSDISVLIFTFLKYFFAALYRQVANLSALVLPGVV